MRSVILAAALGLASTAAFAEDFKFASFFAPTHPYVEGAFDPFAEKVAENSGGDLSVTIYNGGELGPGPAEQYSRVLDGVAELAVSLPGYTASTFPLTLVAELPGVLNTETGTADIWNNIELFQPEYRRAILVSLWSSAPNQLYTRDKAVRSPADIEGMKIRVPSRNTGLLVEAWGATPVSMPVSEIYNALQTGVIDGAMIDTTATRAFRLGEVANYLTIGMDTTNSPFFILANRDAFNSLDDAQQKALLDAGKEASAEANEVQLAVAAGGVEAFAEIEGREVIELTAEEAAAFNALSAPVTEKVVAETGGNAQAIVDALAH
ncbi:TRAP transporter substrate-binding protein [Alloyangia pacifica]|uniref:TRAP-type C4-dicarboxylate transport system, substrate-binding protein n=1 Tax=Alloyangia pacifica TaxID=311180 RepID=A0A1I6T1P8_9RHOB|nr:TRAP transporter substrate-binding protein [Alloyangia pacifica]SDG94349.1 TRAP-type C4-dicarboxylate transport system, substrate-binding protein [Alloyangia pacifica]SFS83135.1 TRAP-type C4-dicarboxylate transport system, substrate-binding protein [Alloyangia pacifica]